MSTPSDDPPRLDLSTGPDGELLAPLVRAARGRGPSAERVETLAQRVVAAWLPIAGGGGGGTPQAGGGGSATAGAAGTGGLGAAGKLGVAVALLAAGGGAIWFAAARHTRAPVAVTTGSGSESAVPVPVPPTPPAITAALPAVAASEHDPDPAPAAHRRATIAEASWRDLSEVELLRQANAAAHQDPRRTLGLMAEHRRRFAGSALVQEREVLTIEALVALRRVNEAKHRAAEFKARFPWSANAGRIDAALRAADVR